MSKRKLLAGLLILSMTAALFTGCGIGADNKLTPTSETEQAITESEAGSTGKMIAQAASYPKQASYPYMISETEADEESFDSWEEQQNERYQAAEDVKTGIDAFTKKTIAEFLNGQDENKVYAPTNVYMALGLLGMCAEGETQEQILSLLGVDDKDALADAAKKLWTASYSDDGANTSLLANSVWLSDVLSYKKEALADLAENFYTSSYSGQMGSEAYNEMLRQWINENTNDLLKDQTDSIEMDAQTVLALASTIYYKAKWFSEFDSAETAEAVFHGRSGDTTTDFLNGQEMTDVIKGDDYTAFCLSFATDGAMWVVLPDEGVSTEDVLRESEVQEILAGNGYQLDSIYADLTLHMPKFDVGGSMDLVDGLKNLGITDAFDENADFSGILEDTDACVSEILHGARVKVDEEGVEAAAFTLEMMAGASLPEPMEITVDRPFLFSIVNGVGLPLFTGNVNEL